MFKNVASQTLTLSVWDSATGTQKTGDASNLVFYVDKDDAGPNAIASNSGVPSEISSTNAKGDYKIALSQSETNADKLHFTGKSSTSGIVVVSKTIYTVPNRFTSLVIDAAGLADANAVKLGPSGSGTAQTARDIGASVLLSSGTGTGQLKLASGYVAMTWADIAAPTTTVNLSGTTVKSVTDVAATLGTPADSTIATDIANARIDVQAVDAKIGTPAVTVSDDLVEVRTAIADDVLGAISTVDGKIGTPSDLGTGSNLAANLVDIAALIDAVPTTTEIWANGTRTLTAGTNIVLAKGTGVTGFNDIAAGAAMTLTSAYDFAKGTVAVTESYNTDGAAPTPVQALMVIMQMLTEMAISGTTMTIKKLDGSTTAFTLTLNDATTPTSVTRAT